MPQIHTISTVTPVYRGAAYLEKLVQELAQLRELLQNETEIIRLEESIFVLDGCVDDSDEILARLAGEHRWIKVVSLSRNFGQHPATVAGFLHSSSDWVATLDEDLQHRPEHIVHLWERVTSQSADIVYAMPNTSVHGSIIRDKLSILFKRLIGRLSGTPQAKYFNSFRIVRGEIARAAAAISRHQTYLDIALSWFTTRVVTCPLTVSDRRFRSSGQTGYSLWRLMGHGKRMIMTTKMKFLRWGLFFGMIAFVFSVVLGSYSLIARILDFENIGVQGWSSLMLAILLFGGLASLMLGVALESISDMLMGINGRPTFFVVDRTRDQEICRSLQDINHENLPAEKS